MTRGFVGVVLACVALHAGAAAPAAAQQRDTLASPRAPGGSRAQQGIERLVRNRLGLSDDQLRRLRAVNAEFAPRREQLWRSERGARVGIRRALVQGDTAASGPLPRLIDELLVVQRRRLDLVAEEQRALSAFLSPVQRARYLSLQEQVRRRVDGARRERGRRGGAAGAGGRPR